MGWTGEILNGVSGFTKIGVSLGDLENALGRSTAKGHIQLIGDVIQVNGTWQFANAINKMAKYKPFKNANATFSDFSARNSARAAARYGMAEPTLFYPNSFAAPPAWVYDRPVTISNNTVSITHPLRAEDFIKDTSTASAGYDPNAVSPLAMDIVSTGGLKAAGTFAILLWKEAYVNNYLSLISDSGEWWADRSLSVQDILHGGSTSNHYEDYYIAFIFSVYNAAGTSITDANLVTTNKKFGNISSQEVFVFYPQGNGTGGDYVESNIHYPIIPLLEGTTYAGRNFMVTVCLTNTGPSNTTTYAYQVIANNNSCVSLGFDADKRYDYTITKAQSTSAIDMLSAVFNTGPTLTLVRQLSGGWNEYSCSAWVTASVTSEAGWTGTSATVQVSATAPFGTFGNIPGESGSYGEYTSEVSISVPSGGHTNTRQLIQLPNVFIYRDATHSVVVTAKFIQNTNQKPFSNSLTITD